MSNTRRAKWTREQVTAANAIDIFEAAIEEATAASVRRILGGHLTTDLVARGATPDVVAAFDQGLASLTDDDWLDIGAGWGVI